eukprot:TRINITY_DN6627_c0_g1_i3.p1 TRINITY_DN6627_c0_g1~~TRINITY_DN6627_c0_g1_i3.p1  ORF type:complete len:513 (-),score=107.59 TRINITY_DN6627_c0_g1_i3:553-1974(-)
MIQYDHLGVNWGCQRAATNLMATVGTKTEKMEAVVSTQSTGGNILPQDQNRMIPTTFVNRLLSVRFILLFSLCCLVDSVHVFDVYRMIQYDHLGVNWGCQRAATNLMATVGTKTEKMWKYILIVPVEQVTKEFIEDKTSTNHSAGGLLLLLPEPGKQSPEFDVDTWKSVEENLLHRRIDIPVWFTHRTTEVEALYQEIKYEEGKDSPSSSFISGLLGSDSYRLSTTGPESYPINNFDLVNIQGTLYGRGRGEIAETIVIVANYDSFSLVPGMVSPSDSGRSGVLATLELARLFSKLYKGTKKTQGDYNLLFVLTGGGQLAHEGTKQWLNSHPDVLNSIQFVICIDSIGTGDLYLHSNRLASKDTNAKSIYDAFSLVAQHMGIPFQVVHKRVNILSEEVPWQHEVFSKKHIRAMTLTNLPAPIPFMSRTTLFDDDVDFLALQRNIRFLGEALARIIFRISFEGKVVVQGDVVHD